jgi:hypothetical protein
MPRQRIAFDQPKGLDRVNPERVTQTGNLTFVPGDCLIELRLSDRQEPQY